MMWEYLFGYARKDKPLKISFIDPSSEQQQLYRDVDLDTLGVHGWELVAVHLGESEASGEARYEYWLKREKRTDGAKSTLGK